MRTLLCFTLVFFFAVTIYSQKFEVFVDARDGEEYSIVLLDSTWWMVENLNFKSPDSESFEDELIACGEWGRLYSLEESKKVCPKGWRLPAIRDWLVLKSIIDEEGILSLYNGDRWKNNEEATNSSGLSLVPSGMMHKRKFLHQYFNCSIWFSDSTEEGDKWHFHTDGNNNEQPYYFHTHEDEVYVRKFAVRCVCEDGKLNQP